MSKYNTVLFDLFDTLINFEPNLLKELEFNGEILYTTGHDVFNVFKIHYPKVGFKNFYPPFIESYYDFQELKNKEYREYPCRERFRIMLNKLNLQPKKLILDNLVDVHMKSLSQCMVFPEENKEILEYLKKNGYRLFIISNFDHAKTVYNLLEKFHINPYFQKIFISEEIGWRKPSEKIFNFVIEKTKIDTDRTILIGDDCLADVQGAKNLGIDVIWINRKNASSNNSCPDYKIKDLKEIKQLL